MNQKDKSEKSFIVKFNKEDKVEKSKQLFSTEHNINIGNENNENNNNNSSDKKKKCQ